MTYHDWESAVGALRGFTEKVTPEQALLAQDLHITLDRKLPALAAAERLKSHLRSPLRLQKDQEPTNDQLEFLADLCDDLGVNPIVDPGSRTEASAWIDVLSAQRAIAALRRLQIRAGDVVGKLDSGGLPDPDTAEIVSSIGEDGTVYFRGGRGQRAWPHRLGVLARADTRAKEAEAVRALANERIAQRATFAGAPSLESIAHLEPHRVKERAGPLEAQLIEHALDKAEDERPLQRLFTSTPSTLSALVRSTRGTFVVPLPRLGSRYVPDFAVGHADSAGMHWLLVELESPKAVITTQRGEPAKPLRAAISQVENWRDWLRDNLDEARRPPRENGLGLTQIMPNPRALILIGTSGPHPGIFENRRRRYEQENRILIHSYSWLVEMLRTSDSPIQGPLDQHGWY